MDHFFQTAEIKNAKTVSITDQQHFTKLIARWTVCCLRPFSISEDAELQTAFDFASQVKGNFKLEPGLWRLANTPFSLHRSLSSLGSWPVPHRKEQKKRGWGRWWGKQQRGWITVGCMHWWFHRFLQWYWGTSVCKKNCFESVKNYKIIENLTKSKELLKRIQGLEECDQILHDALDM